MGHFESLNCFLDRIIYLCSVRASIEILPGDAKYWTLDSVINQGRYPSSTSPYLFLDGNLGVPQKVLYKSYMAAIILFKSLRKGTRGVTAEKAVVADLIASSSVILLGNPAHQTALNARKRLIQNGHLEPQRELAFTAALLSARECAKQCILWDHRRWLFRRIYGHVNFQLHIEPSASESDAADEGCPTRYVDRSCSVDIPPEIIRKEFTIISRACEIYPRNYYAWIHWRFCVNTLYHFLSSNLSESAGKDQRADLLAHEIVRLRHWIDQHISDHSAVHHLCSVIQRLNSLHLHGTFFSGNDETFPSLRDLIDPASSMDHALSLVAAYPSYDSLWMYLRATLCFSGGERRENVSRVMAVFSKGEPLPQQAYQLLAWRAHQVC